MGGYLEPGAVKEVKFKFWSDDHAVCNAGFFHVFYGPKAYIFWILVEGLIFSLSDGADVAAHGQCGDLCKWIYVGCIRVRQKYHVAFFNGCVAVVRAVKTDSLGKCIFPEPLYRNGDVAPASVNVCHFKINHADLVFFT